MRGSTVIVPPIGCAVSIGRSNTPVAACVFLDFTPVNVCASATIENPKPYNTKVHTSIRKKAMCDKYVGRIKCLRLGGCERNNIVPCIVAAPNEKA